LHLEREVIKLIVNIISHLSLATIGFILFADVQNNLQIFKTMSNIVNVWVPLYMNVLDWQFARR